MSNSLEHLHSVASQISEQLSLEGKVQVFFRPSVDLQYGDFFSEGAFHLSRRDGGSPDIAGRDIMQRFPSEIAEHLSLSSGYLNFRIPDVNDCLRTYTSSRAGWSATSVLVSPPIESVSGWEYLRVVACGLMQVLIAREVGVSVKPVFPFAAASDERVEAVMQGCSVLLDKLPGSGSAVESWGCQLSTVKSGVVWSHPAIMKAAGVRRDDLFPGICLRYPRGSGRMPALSETSRFNLDQMFDRDLLGLIFYLAHPDVQKEFDPEIALLQTSGNLCWFMESLRQRARRIIGETATVEQLQNPEGVLTGDRLPFIRAIQMDDLMFGAGGRGEIEELLLVLHELAQSFARRLNAVAFRGTLADCSAYDQIACLSEYIALERIASVCSSPVKGDVV